jgi:hypothetical protein
MACAVMPVFPMLEVFMKRTTCEPMQPCQFWRNSTHTRDRKRSHLASSQVELNYHVIVRGGSRGNGAKQITARGALQTKKERMGAA